MPVNVPVLSALPAWMWPVVLAGVLGYSLYQAIKASELVAHWFGRLGHHIHDRAVSNRRLLAHLQRIETAWETTTDQLQCATAYLCVIDTPWHLDVETILAQQAPGVQLPPRIPFVDFKRRWQQGWRPAEYREDV